MTHIHDDIEHVKNHVELENKAEVQEKQEQKLETQRTEKQMKELLYAISKDLTSNDKSDDGSHLVQTDAKAPGFEILFVSHGGHNPTPFSVTATCKGSNVELQISDGKWESIPNVSGNWGHWADTKTAYSGPVNESKIYKVITESFLTWYKKVLQ
ncbi:hypothetical protein [Alicyclobacillus sp. SO9]|uniref:hypothetical protein n=1 Tax=Alicyclobacillus sp. SO9 TaxID=2665646 RepID=UPI0018E7B56F|nr:hypothetical protein [Alicyclobacillus sp. SO9]QQE79346.1 hypothetical protein GI364_02205 [Alicyclobacillus sp. SO9]